MNILIKLKKKYLMLFLLTLITANRTYGRIPIEQIKDLNLINSEYDELNPLNGIPWDYGILENYGELLDENDPLRIFIQTLFHRTGTFDPSTSNSNKIVTKLSDFKILGYLVANMKKNKISTQKILFQC